MLWWNTPYQRDDQWALGREEELEYGTWYGGTVTGLDWSTGTVKVGRAWMGGRGCGRVSLWACGGGSGVGRAWVQVLGGMACGCLGVRNKGVRVTSPAGVH